MSRVEGKMSRVEGKMSRVEGKMSRVESKMSRVESKMSRVQKCRGIFNLKNLKPSGRLKGDFCTIETTETEKNPVAISRRISGAPDG